MAAGRRNDHRDAAAHGWTDTRSGGRQGPITGVYTTFNTAGFASSGVGSNEYHNHIDNNEAGVIGTGRNNTQPREQRLVRTVIQPSAYGRRNTG